MIKRIIYLLSVGVLLASFTILPKPSLKLALLKYNGGGDWYSNPTSHQLKMHHCSCWDIMSRHNSIRILTIR